MKKIYWLVSGLLLASSAQAESFNWDKLARERIDLKLPLLTVQGEKGLLACAYLSVATCDKTGEACAIVSGVNNHDEMLAKPIVAVSQAASKLGIVLGMSGEQALQLLR
ncbi:YunC family protein [Paraglaciecola sp.]|uniref:YunC family protein n=1 Tax=Paraglaciecola sp. TaxID=1920173 RepID=UPI0030F38B0F